MEITPESIDAEIERLISEKNVSFGISVEDFVIDSQRKESNNDSFDALCVYLTLIKMHFSFDLDGYVNRALISSDLLFNNFKNEIRSRFNNSNSRYIFEDDPVLPFVDWAVSKLSQSINVPLEHRLESKEIPFRLGVFHKTGKTYPNSVDMFCKVWSMSDELFGSEKEYWQRKFLNKIPKLKDLTLGHSVVVEDNRYSDKIIYKWVNPLRVETADHEIEIAQALNEAGIETAEYYGFFDLGGTYFLAMEKVEGVDLSKVFYSDALVSYLEKPCFIEYLRKTFGMGKVTQEFVKNKVEEAYKLYGEIASKASRAKIGLNDFVPRNAVLYYDEDKQAKIKLIDFEHSRLGESNQDFLFELQVNLEDVRAKAFSEGYKMSQRETQMRLF